VKGGTGSKSTTVEGQRIVADLRDEWLKATSVFRDAEVLEKYHNGLRQSLY